jgi:hypothetical protein
MQTDFRINDDLTECFRSTYSPGMGMAGSLDFNQKIAL